MSEGAPEKRPSDAQTFDRNGRVIKIANPVTYFGRWNKKVAEGCRVMRIIQTEGSYNGWMIITHLSWECPKMVPPWKVEYGTYERPYDPRKAKKAKAKKVEIKKADPVPAPSDKLHHGATRKIGEKSYRHCRKCGWVPTAAWPEHQGH